jgi:hypothetical protein
MTQDEIDKIYHQMEKWIIENREQMEHKMDEMGNKMYKMMNDNRNEMKKNMDEMENNIDKKMDEMEKKMDKKMDENKIDIKEQIQKLMKEMQNSLSSMIFHALDERISKGNIKMHGTQKNKGSILVEQPVDNKQFSSGFKSNSGVNYGGGTKLQFPKTELKNFYGTKEERFCSSHIGHGVKGNFTESASFFVLAFKEKRAECSHLLAGFSPVLGFPCYIFCLFVDGV